MVKLEEQSSTQSCAPGVKLPKPCWKHWKCKNHEAEMASFWARVQIMKSPSAYTQSSPSLPIISTKNENKSLKKPKLIQVQCTMYNFCVYKNHLRKGLLF